MKRINLPDQRLLRKTSYADGYQLNYKFLIKHIQRVRFKAILKMMGNNVYYNLLEVGTGSGIFLPELSKHCKNLYALDIHDNIKQVENFCKITSVNAKLSKCSIEKTFFPNNMFDGIVAVSVLEFVSDLTKSIYEIKRILTPNGVFLTVCPQPGIFFDLILSLYLSKEAIVSKPRTVVSPMLEKQFKIIKKTVFPPLLGKYFPAYFFYKLKK